MTNGAVLLEAVRSLPGRFGARISPLSVPELFSAATGRKITNYNAVV